MRAPIPRPQAIALALLVSVAPALAAPCDGLDTRLTPERQRHFAPIVARVADGAAGAEVTGFAQEGPWLFVHAGFADLDPAFFFFRTEGSRMRFVDLWAGFTVEEERAEDIAWAQRIGAPPKLAACFAAAAIGG